MDINQEPEDLERQVLLPLGKRSLRLPTLISFLVALIILFFLFTRFDIDLRETFANIRRSDPFLYLLAFVTYYLSFALRGLRWRLLLKNVAVVSGSGRRFPSIFRLGEYIFLAWFVNVISVVKVGDAYRAWLLAQRSGASFLKALGTIMAERILEVFIFFALLLTATLSLWHTRSLGTGWGILGLAAVLVIGCAIILIILRFYGQPMERWLPARARPYFNRLYTGIVGSLRHLPLLVALTALIWFTEAGRLLFVSRSLGFVIPYSLILFVALANSLLSTLPITPGGLGIVEAGVTGLLVVALPRASAMSVTLLDRSITFASVLIFGLILFSFHSLLARRGSKSTPKPTSSDGA